MNVGTLQRLVSCAAAATMALEALAADVPVRFMTYNVQYCRYLPEGATSEIFDPAVTAARILAENPDFCCVNEVRDSAAHPEADALAAATGMHKTFGGNDSGSNGNLILSKEEPIGSETLFLKMAPRPVGWGDRYCLICEFTNFCVATTHLDTTDQGPAAEVLASNAVAIATIRAALAKYTKPVFLCGDWNTRPNWENMARFNAFLEVISPTNGVRTYHGHKATGGYILDYISVDKAHKDDFYVQSSRVVEDLVTSDHNPVIAEVYRRPAATDLDWVDERFLSTGLTGTWTPAVTWNGGTWQADLGVENVFVPRTPSGGNRVVMDVTVAFDAVPEAEAMPGVTAQTAIWLGTNGCFQVWTRLRQGSGGQAGWVDVEAEGVMPEVGVEYTFRVSLDYRTGTYSVEVRTGSTGFARLKEKNPVNPVNPVQNFPIAVQASCVSRVKFIGSGAFRSLVGEWAQKVRAFMIHIR